MPNFATVIAVLILKFCALKSRKRKCEQREEEGEREWEEGESTNNKVALALAMNFRFLLLNRDNAKRSLRLSFLAHGFQFAFSRSL